MSESLKISLTCTTIFLLPQLKIPRESILDRDIGFENAYWKDAQAEVQYKNSISVLFKPRNLTRFHEFVQSERARTTMLIDDYDYEGGYTVLVYQLPKGFKEDLKRFKRGEYSQFSKKWQEAYPETVKVKDTATGLETEDKGLAWRVCNKYYDLKEFWENRLGYSFSNDQELWLKPAKSKDILKMGISPMRILI